MTQWRWVREDLVFAAHDVQLAEHGGLPGVRNRDTVLAALARPQQLAWYGAPSPDVATLAAAYAYGLARSQGFNDGNKRIAFIAALLFLTLNGCALRGFNKAASVIAMNDVASGRMSEEELAQWFREMLSGG